MNCFEYCVPFAIMFFLHILILYHLLEEVIFTLYYLYTTTKFHMILLMSCRPLLSSISFYFSLKSIFPGRGSVFLPGKMLSSYTASRACRLRKWFFKHAPTSTTKFLHESNSRSICLSTIYSQVFLFICRKWLFKKVSTFIRPFFLSVRPRYNMILSFGPSTGHANENAFTSFIHYAFSYAVSA